ncbi:hypothetical protein FKW77_007039 [Venturia effusa]|uniref:Uncharacterized protein n=1 Tax=Venturia effusa TaxID=50376 RepID=A0A517LKH7_9PEZI|nr:hypothetical protein FKW77_007039 [Venturia effusa]
MINPLKLAVFGLLAVSTSVLATEAATDGKAAVAAPADHPYGYGYDSHGGRPEWEHGAKGGDYGHGGEKYGEKYGGRGYKAKRSTAADAKANEPYGYGHGGHEGRPEWEHGGKGADYGKHGDYGHGGAKYGGHGYKAKRDAAAVAAADAKANEPYGYGYNGHEGHPEWEHGGKSGDYGHGGEKYGGRGYKARRGEVAVAARDAKADGAWGYGKDHGHSGDWKGGEEYGKEHEHGGEWKAGKEYGHGRGW